MATRLSRGIPALVIAGLTTAFGHRGYDGRLYSGEAIHRVNLVSLDGEFCTVRSTHEVLGAIA